MAMKSAAAVLSVTALAQAASVDTASPVAKVISMIGDLEKKILAEGEEGQKAYDDYAEWCEDTSKNLNFEIKTGKGNVESLKATIEEETSKSEALTAKIEELAETIATADADLTAATDVRTKEAADFAAEEKELEEVIDTLGRAVGILEKEMAGGASLIQNSGSVVQALQTLVQATALSAADGNRLTALLQSSQSQESDDSDDAAGAPAAAVYESKSGSIVDVLGDLQEKAQAQLDDSRKKETAALHNFEMLKQSLTDAIKFGTSDTDAAKKEIAASAEAKATAEGDLDVTSKDLGADIGSLADLHHQCMNKASEFESATTARGEELKALATAKKVIKEATAGAESQTYSFLQVRSGVTSEAELAKFEAVRYVRDLAHKTKAPALAQLAKRMATAMRMSAGSADPFAKVKGLIEDMLAKLESEADADATENAFCEKENAENTEKKTDLTTEVEKLTTKIDQATARSTKLKEEVATLQKELKELASSVASWTKFRQEEKAVYDKDRPELEQGLEGIKTALKVLRDYYAKNSDASGTGASSGIIGLLEVCESDFSKGLAEMVATEENAVAEYESVMKDAQVEQAAKDKDVEYKTKEHVGLDKSVTELTGDRSGVQSELDAVNEYLAKLADRCIAKPDTYAERKERREAELAGLKEALNILSNEAASLIQKGSKKFLSVVRKHA